MVRTGSLCSAALVTAGLLCLNGCSSDGAMDGGVRMSMNTSAPAMPTSGIAVNLQPANTTMTYPAAAATAMGAAKGMNAISFSALGQGATITLSTDASGNLSGVKIPAGGINDTMIPVSGIPLADPRTLDFTFQLSDTLAFTDQHAYAISQAASQGLTASAYGIWAATMAAPAPPGDAGVFAFGNVAPAMVVPTAGSATYTGHTVGVGGDINGLGIYFLKGDARIVANFAAQTVTSTLSNFTAGSYTASVMTVTVPTLTGTAAIAGNAYSGPISGGALTGTLSGNFYGPMAQETAGVWRAAGGGVAWIGSFGAK